MTTEELRIGNYIYESDHKEYGQIIMINIKGYLGLRFKDDDTNGFIDWECLRPIPLTEDLLLKCGFDKLMCYKLDDIYIDTNNGGFWAMIGGVGGKAISIEYLHQLQNLHYCITGKELEINL